MNIRKEEIWNLIAKVVFEEASEQELVLLHSQLKLYPDLQKQYDILTWVIKKNNGFIKEIENNDAKVQYIIEKANNLRAIQNNKTKTANKSRYLLRTLMGAAAVLLIFTYAWLFFNKRNTKEELQPVLMAENGSRKQMVLPDGTKVWLNAGSELFIIKDFKTADTREVQLEGEGFFDVKKDSTHPFIVHANNIDIRVLGTAFNVKAYKDDKNVEATLLRGLINVSKNNDKDFKPVLLYPNQKIILPADNDVESKNIIEKSEGDLETAWVQGRLEFRGDSFEKLAYKMERWYNVSIHFEDKKVESLSFNGSFEKETIQQALAALKSANNFNYKINKNEIRISSAN